MTDTASRRITFIMAIRKVVASLAALLVLVAATVAVAPQAGALHYSSAVNMTCGYPQPAPNAVAVCSTWVGNAWYPGTTYKIDATQHYGWWGPNWDPGTWHVIIYIYVGGVFQGQVFNMDIGDWAIPYVRHGPVGANPESHATLWFISDALWTGGGNTHRFCANTYTVGTVWVEDTAGDWAWQPGQGWPWAADLNGGYCQHGFGSHTGNVRHAPYGLFAQGIFGGRYEVQ